MITKNLLIQKIINSDHKHDVHQIEKAIDLATKYHDGQLRASGDPYIGHPLEVASMVVDINLDTASIITAVLHDTVEDTELTLEDIKNEFGEEISKLVHGVTNLTRVDFQPANVRQAENFRKFLIAMSEDIRVLLIKLSDRLHNMRTIDFIKSNEKKQRIALETMEIYAPLAERIGMHQYKTELQDISFRILYPRMRNSIIEKINELFGEDDTIIERISNEIKTHLQEKGIEAKVTGRKKTPYSIWMKLNQKNVSLDQLSDIVAFRIVVKDLMDCYKSLGVVHFHYKMVPENFIDFISTPKSNGYQSLHTIVIGPLQERIEIQIRTEAMHEIAELGVAAHWAYKQNYNDTDGKKFRWINELLHILEQTPDSDELLQNTKLGLYYDQVFCFTPQGKIITLPKGSTSVDFAYAVHSKIGHHCSGAKVNGKIVPLKTQLKNGDRVDIITNNNQTPSSSWEEFVVTGKAKSEIRKFIRQQRFNQYVHLGKNILEKSAKSASIHLFENDLLKIASKYSFKTVDELYCAVGEGRVGRDEIIKILRSDTKQGITDKLVSFFKRKDNVKENVKQKSLAIDGLIPGMAISYAKCCNPIPGDSIIGVVHTGKGVTIHVSDCDMLKSNEIGNEILDIKWNNGSDNNNLYVIKLKIILINESGGLATLTSELAKHKANITNLKITNRNSDFFELVVDVEIESTDHLNTILSALKSKKSIQSIERYKQ